MSKKTKSQTKQSVSTFVDLIDLFTMKDLAEKLGVKYVMVQKMRHRNRIDPKYWVKMAELTKDLGRGKRVTLEEIHALKSGRENHPGTRHGVQKIAA